MQARAAAGAVAPVEVEPVSAERRHASFLELAFEERDINSSCDLNTADIGENDA
jgi:hypothetical protein